MDAIAWLAVAADATDLLIENPSPSASGRHQTAWPPALRRSLDVEALARGAYMSAGHLSRVTRI
jgi:hypothetical protein